MKSRRRGLTVMEILLAFALFGLLGTLLVTAFRQGFRAMAQGSIRAQLVNETNQGCHRFNREVERGLYESLSSTPNMCSLLSAIDDQGVFKYSPGSSVPNWQNFYVFYLDAANQRFKLRKVSVVGTPTETAPRTIEQFGGVPLSTYANGGQALAHHIYALDFSVTPDHQLVMSIGAEMTRPGAVQPDRFVQRTVSNFRN